MDNRQQRTLQTLLRIKLFLDDNRLTPAPPLLAGMRKSLEASMKRIESLGFEQHIANRSRDGKVELRRRKLRRDRMMPLVRIAKPLLAFAPGVVMLNYGGDAATQAVWRRTRRVSARMGRPKQRSNRRQPPAPPPS